MWNLLLNFLVAIGVEAVDFLGDEFENGDVAVADLISLYFWAYFL